jgi:hypothetical protein
MLSHAIARTGHPVLILNGKLLASKFDPIAEAQKWVAQLTPLSAESAVQFVLGAGSGYALVALANKFPQSQIIAFTTQPEIIKFWQEELKNETALARIAFVHLTSAEDFAASPLLFDVIEKTFVVHEHPSALVENSVHFKSLKEVLLGRTYTSFRAQAQQHKSYAEISQVLLPTIGPISIKNLSDSLNLAHEFEFESCSEILVLRELVK